MMKTAARYCCASDYVLEEMIVPGGTPPPVVDRALLESVRQRVGCTPQRKRAMDGTVLGVPRESARYTEGP